MKNNPRQLLVLTAVLCLTASVEAQQNPTPNRYHIGPRFGFNVSGQFSKIGDGLFTAQNPNPRFTPDGDAYNYDDGYILTDISGNFGGQTWYVGYDDSATQISGDNLLLSRSTASTSSTSASDDLDETLGFEVGYRGEVWREGKRSWGFLVTGSWQPLDMKLKGNFSGNVTRVTDTYSFTPGTTPPAASPGNPYQGSSGGAGFLFNDALVSSSTSVVGGGTTVNGSYKLDGGMVGLHFGVYAELALSERLSVSLQGGLATALIHADGSWTESAALPGGGSVTQSGDDSDESGKAGLFLAAELSYKLGKDWTLTGAFQFENIGKYKNNFGGRTAELDFNDALFVVIGVSKSF